MNFNGWTNWATWNVNLWAMNDEALYGAVVSNRPFTAESAKRLVLALMPSGTPDMDTPNELDGVNWIELANAWSEK